MTLSECVSAIIRLKPSDIIASGTRSNVGHGRNPEHRVEGEEMVIAEIHGIGRLENLVVRDRA